MSDQDWLFSRRNEDGSVSIDIPKEWPEGIKDNFNDALDLFIQRGAEVEQARIIKLLQIGGPIEKIICEYWGNDDYDKDDALAMIELAIKGETE